VGGKVLAQKKHRGRLLDPGVIMRTTPGQFNLEFG